MSREKNLIKNTAIISLGTFFPKFIAILVTPILTGKLTNAEYGTYDLLITIVSLLLPAVTLQISSAAFRFLIEERNNIEKSKEIITTILGFTIVIATLSSLIFAVIASFKFPKCKIEATVYLLFDILLITLQQIARGLGKTLQYSISCIVRSVTDTFFIAALLGAFGGTNYGVKGAFFANGFACVLATVILFFGLKIYSYFEWHKFSFKELKRLLSYSWPMVPNNLSGWVLRLSDRLVITAVLGLEANSIYAVATKMPTIFSSVQDTFSLAWQENASLASKDNDKDLYYSQMCDGVFSLLTGLMAGLMMCTPIIWRLLIRGDYAASYKQLPVLYMGMYFSCLSLTLGGIYIAHMRTKNVGFTTMLAALVNLSIDLALIKVIGIWAGSISTLVSYIFLFIYRMINVQKFQRIKFYVFKIVASVLLLTIMGVLSYINSYVTNLLNILMCIIVLLIFDRNIIKTIFSSVYKKVIRR